MKYRFKTKPRPYQVRAMKHLLKNRGGALFMPMRSGKTKVAIDATAALQRMSGHRLRALVVCPKSVLPVWPAEVRKHCPREADIEWRFVNFESIYSRVNKQAADKEELIAWAPHVIIVDESHRIGDPGTNISKFSYRLQKLSPPEMKIIMTGTPYHRGKRLLIFGQFKFLDESVFGTAITPFKGEYANWGGYGGYVLKNYKAQKKMRNKIKPHVFQMAHVPPVPPQHVSLEFSLEEAEEAYSKLANEEIYRSPQGWTVTADHPFSRAQKLATMESGWVKDEDGNWQRVGHEKLRLFQERLEYFREQDILKLVVFCSFLPELKDCVQASRAAGYVPLLMYGKTSTEAREERLGVFDEADDPAIFICQVRTGSVGIDMSAASTAIYYNHIMGAVDYDQSMARIRKYKDRRTLTYEHIYGRGCVGSVSYAGLHAGLDLARHFMEHPDLLTYRGTG